MSTRERKLRFIGNKYAVYRAVEDMLLRKGADWLTDDQVDDLVHQELANIRRRNRDNRRNRAIHRQCDEIQATTAPLRLVRPPVMRAADVMQDDGPEAA